MGKSTAPKVPERVFLSSQLVFCSSDFSWIFLAFLQIFFDFSCLLLFNVVALIPSISFCLHCSWQLNLNELTSLPVLHVANNFQRPHKFACTARGKTTFNALTKRRLKASLFVQLREL